MYRGDNKACEQYWNSTSIEVEGSTSYTQAFQSNVRGLCISVHMICTFSIQQCVE